MDIDTQTADAFKQAMSSLAGAVTLITVAEDGHWNGMVATAVCSLSAQPASVLACVNRTASSHDTILRQARFAINFPGINSLDVVDQFNRSKGQDRFDSTRWIEGASGMPVLRDARAVLECRVEKVHDGFSHSILVGVVDHVHMAHDESGPCLMWKDRRFHITSELGC
jgi:flavin reductase